ncbi:MAG TPA: TIGR03668 family PPOX class F420-dependent oxidoreductase [Rhizomicrobium sp.]|nr:TIGR03668 family PPOX class F420-dependent oxidoreductase [Rhizomicrobium sp.]
MIFPAPERAFLTRQRIGHLATADRSGVPSVVPVCFAVADDALYTALDEKPKRTRRVRRLQNIEKNPELAFVADYYDEDWSALGWVMIRGRGDILESGAEFETACDLLKRRYAQYAKMTLSPVIAIRLLEVRSWGNLDG